MFEFRAHTNGVLPHGLRYGAWNDRFDECYSGRFSNNTCAAWVIFNGNMDYLHCREKLGWDKAKSCKE